MIIVTSQAVIFEMPFLEKEKLSAEEKKRLELALIKDNIRRGKILSFVIIGFEALFIVISLISLIFDRDERFNYTFYILMYTLMILYNLIFLLLTNRYQNNTEAIREGKRKLEAIIVLYISCIMVWGSIITLADQKIYGQLATFMTNLITCSVIYQLSTRKMLIPYICSVLTLVIGLPYYQMSPDILLGHYVNLMTFIAISWVASRLIYHYYYEFYCSNYKLGISNEQLEARNEENRKINRKLALANHQLKELAMLDELTGIPNRRSFREFIESELHRCLSRTGGEAEGILNPCTISVIMIDIDYFKQYNDSLGHDEGDKVLTAVAGEISAMVEDTDEIAVRWGGEEFIYAAFNKSKTDIEMIAHTIHNRISEQKIPHEASPSGHSITVSAGVCTVLINERDDIQKAVRLADRALYAAKKNGRNCVIILEDDELD